MKCLLFAIAIALTVSQLKAHLLEPDCGVPGRTWIQPRIINGTTAEIGSSPWMAYLHTPTHFQCAGSLVNHWLVLTAAHCLQKDQVLTVRLGEYDRKSKTQDCAGGRCQGPAEEYRIAKAFRSRRYNRDDQSNDIAMFKLARRVEYKPHIQPICIFMDPHMKAQIDSLTWFTATGWGRDNPYGKTTQILHTLAIRRQDNQECAQMFGREVGSNQICVGNEHSNLCNGDSGGPVGRMMLYKGQRRFFQLGINSYTNLQCQHLSVLTDVVSHQDWIQRVVDYGSRPVQLRSMRPVMETDEVPTFVNPL
ncbi:hypothetical protein KR054_008027 [Drosophila jambulina]|nr:hypothetical protein KR054_008027 [Drosophila jambulina]